MITRVLPGGLKGGSQAGQYRLALDVLLVMLDDGSARVLNLSGNCYAISPIGAEMLYHALSEGEENSAETLSSKYDAPIATIVDDQSSFLQSLERRRLIYRAQGRPQRDLHRISALAIQSVLKAIRAAVRSPDRRAWFLLTAARLSMVLGFDASVSGWRPQRAWNPSKEHRRDASASEINEIVRSSAARHFLHITCKERALVCWTLLHWYGLQSKLVVGVELFPFSGHCWCEVQTKNAVVILSDYPERAQRFVPVMTYS